ncbi:DUF1990 domain-containing protein [Phycicoccus sp. MAQZ13P-2]|uniref:DUF1990 family protein n=1 Tax=Phycicoccus mangrovi TaxID=2840470 RepID=UPI001BFFF9D8|nr:DUF1990 domain-containing protein [Phycicoccus mangrovi]MBT9256266.1 DUF1990 domain-containing protein [Phycicoccus mangrovi]MBT9273719.1 DUF1990 domain-containing protein [Phycicoccus mangrovi]
MPVDHLPPRERARLTAARLSYDATRRPLDVPPAGYGVLDESVVLSRTDFERTAHDLLTWQVQGRAGLRVRTSRLPLRTGTVVEMRWGVGPLALRIPCRVVEVLDEPGRAGFTYGTLVGHPEAGEERFLLERLDDGRLRFRITAVSRPATPLARLAGPVGRAAQRWMTHRYLRALDRPEAS